MPIINITEREDISFASFDATENVVLVPFVYIRTIKIDDTTKEEIHEQLPKPTLFRNVSTFRDAYGTKDDEKYSYLVFDSEQSIIDRTYFMIYELLLQGMAVLVVPIDGGEAYFKNKFVVYDEDQQKKFISEFFESKSEEFKDRNLYNIKFISSGAYSNIDSKVDKEPKYAAPAKLMVNLAETRGDAIALLEMPVSYIDQEGEHPITTAFDIKTFLVSSFGIDTNKSFKYAEMGFPWAQFSTSAHRDVEYVTLPSSFAYLMAYANSVKTNANWFAAAGTIRGAIPNLIEPKVEVGEALMHFLQNDGGYVAADGEEGNKLYIPVNINPIYNAGSYGYRIWGNKVAWRKSTTENNQYLEYLNVRILMCDIKKQIFHAAMRVTFEPNDDIVWYNFKSLANTLLDRMKSGRGIKWYKWFKEETKEKALIRATLTIKPIEAVESFDINIVLTDKDAEFEEVE